jgi:hypothetical protein
MGVGEVNALARQLIENGRLDLRVGIVAGKIAETEIVSKHDNNVRRISHRG